MAFVMRCEVLTGHSAEDGNDPVVPKVLTFINNTILPPTSGKKLISVGHTMDNANPQHHIVTVWYSEAR